jgi:hypothetical protein
MIKNPALYAVISNRPDTTRRKRSIVEIREQKHAEFRLKTDIDRAANVLTELEARAQRCALAIRAMQSRKALILARAERIEEEILKRMAKESLDQANGWKIKLVAAPCPASVEITNDRLLPDAFVREKVDRSPDKVAIKAALSRDEDVPGARLVQRISLQRK